MAYHGASSWKSCEHITEMFGMVLARRSGFGNGESCRVFGNFSRTNIPRDIMVSCIEVQCDYETKENETSGSFLRGEKKDTIIPLMKSIFIPRCSANLPALDSLQPLATLASALPFPLDDTTS